MTLNVTERVSTSPSMVYPKCTDMIQARIAKRLRPDSDRTRKRFLSTVYPKCTDTIQARITKRLRSDPSIRIGSPRNRNHDLERMVWHVNLLAAH